MEGKIMTDEKRQPVLGRVKLEGVRLGFPSLWQPQKVQRKDDSGEQSESRAKFQAEFLIPKGSDLTGVTAGKRMPIMKALEAARHSALVKKLGEQNAGKMKIKAANYCVKDGDEETYDSHQGHWFVRSRNVRRPKVVGRDKRDLSEADGIIYSGCYVNAVVTLWYQAAGKRDDNPVPHGVYGSLEAVQFVRDGEAFGAPPIDVDEEFDDLVDDGDGIDDTDIDDEIPL